MAISVAKMRDLQARLLEEREEKAALAGEKAALMARLAKLKDAGTDELREKAELQEALVRSEEQRLEVSRALIDFQMEANEAKQEWANTKFALEQRILELESGRLEHTVRSEDHAALADERDALARRARDAEEDLSRLKRALESERESSAEAFKEVRRLNQLLAALEAASAGDTSALLGDADYEASADDGRPSALSSGAILGSSRQAGAAAVGRSRGVAAAAGGRVNLADVRLQLQQKLKQQGRRVAELESSLFEVQQQLESAQSSRNVMADALEQARGLFKRQMEAAAQDVAQLTQRVALAAGEPGHLLAVGPDELLVKLVTYTDQLLQAAAGSVSEARRETEAVTSRHSSLKRQLRLLYTGYRSLRYKLEDEWPAAAAGGAAPRVPNEDAVMGGSVDEIVRADDESARQELVRQQNKVAALEAALAAAKVRQLEFDTLGPGGAGKLSSRLTAQQPSLTGAAAAALQLENSRLQQELDALKRRLPALGLLTRTNSSSSSNGIGGAGCGLSEQLTSEVAQLRAENQRLRAAATAGAGTGSAATAAEAAGGLRRQLKEFTLNTQLDLEKQLKAAESRTVMAEEQLNHLQRYLATASVAYQREIVRLRAALQQADPAALRALGPAASAAATAAAPTG